MSLYHSIKRFITSDFLKHSSTLLSSNVIAQAIAFVAYPFIARLYPPEVYGDFSLFLTITAVLSTLPTGKYDLAILLPKSERQAGALFVLSNLLNASFLLPLLLILLIGKDFFGQFLVGKDNVIDWLWIIPVFVFLNGVWQSLNNYLLRRKQFANMAGYNLIQNGVGTLTKIGLGLKQFLHSGLIVGQFAGLFLATLFSVLLGRKALCELPKVQKSDLKEVAKTYATFPKYELPNQLVNTLSANLPILLLSFYFDKAYIGIYAFAFNIGFAPVSIFARSISQVLFQRMAERKQHQGPIHEECITFCKVCFFVVLPLFVLLALLPEGFFLWLFSDKWDGVSFYFKLLLPTFFMSLVVASLSFIPDVFMKQKTAVKIELIYVALKAIALGLGIVSRSFATAVILYVVVVVAMLSVKLIWYLRIVKQYEQTKEQL